MGNLIWAVMLKNSIVIVCFTILALEFGHWWIVLFSWLFLTYFDGKRSGDSS